MVHKHLIVRADVAKPITDEEIAKDWVRRVVEAVGMVITKTGGPYADYVDKPGNYGIAAIAMIETSHCSLHVWDRDDPPIIQFDLYSCAEFNPKVVFTFIEEMEPTRISYVLLDRGLLVREVEGMSLNVETDLSKKFPPWFFYD